ncbi:MAG: hypothetical protein QXL17_02645 [Candidatus Thermoplasmatota archaeon]
MTPLEEAKHRALAEIDITAGTIRLKYITEVYGQEQVYIEKANEALDYVIDNCPIDLTFYPFIAAEVDATGMHPRDVANNILQQRSEWIKHMVKIERVRLKGKSEIRKTSNIKDVNTIKQYYTEALNSL